MGRHIDNASKDELKILRSRYGISIMGEGGEYESMTLDSPMFKKRLVINSSNKNIKKGVGTLDVTDVILEDKTSE